MNAAGEAFDFHRDMSRFGTPEALLDGFARFLEGYGFSAFSAGEVVNPYQPPPPHPLLAAFRWPAGWIERWLEGQYQAYDPIAREGLRRCTPFHWHDLRLERRDKGNQIMAEWRDLGMPHGFCIPIRRPGAYFGGVSLAGNRADLHPEEQRLIELCSIQLFDRLDMLSRPTTPRWQPRLSARERDVMHWIAAGKSTPAIAEILGLSEHTVRGYVKTAMRKLNATTQAQAVAIGIRTRELLT